MPRSELTLAQLAKLAAVLDCKLEKIQGVYEDKPSKFLHMANWKQGKELFKLILIGEITTNGVAVNEFTNDGKKSMTYSLGVRLEEEDQEAVETLNTVMAEALPGDFEITNPLKDDIIYFKLKPSVDKKSFGVASNIKLEPKKVAEAPIAMGSIVKVYCDLMSYINFRDAKAGLVFKVTKLEFEQE